MSPALVPVVVVAAGFLVSYGVQQNLVRRFDYRCSRCGEIFSLSPLAATVAPHRLGGRKYTRCPRCGQRSWMDPVAKAP